MIFAEGIDTIADVVAIRAQAIAALKAGSLVVSWNVEGTSVNKVIAMKPFDIIIECNNFLRLVLPDVYGRRMKRTIPVFVS